MKSVAALFLLLLTYSLCEDSPATTLPWMHKKIILKKGKSKLLGRPEYILQFHKPSNNNNTIVTELQNGKIQCKSCTYQQGRERGKEEILCIYTGIMIIILYAENCKKINQCNKTQFNKLWVNQACNCCPPPTDTSSMTIPQTITYPTTMATMASGSFQMTSHIEISIVAFGVIIGLLGLLIILLIITISGWAWTCWIIKKGGMKSLRQYK